MIDFLIGSDNDVFALSGDFKIDDPTEQNVALILSSAKGDFKRDPLAGVGLINYLDAPMGAQQRATFIKSIQLQLIGDGAEPPSVSFTSSGFINIITSYK